MDILIMMDEAFEVGWNLDPEEFWWDEDHFQPRKSLAGRRTRVMLNKRPSSSTGT